MNIKLNYIVECFWNAVRYIPGTLYIAALVLIIGIIFGTLIALGRTYRIKGLSFFLDLYVVIFKAVPVNLLIVASGLVFAMKFNDFAKALGLAVRVNDIHMLYVGVFALSFTCTTQLSENIRGALASIPKGQYEAGYSVGLTPNQTFCRIVFPQLLLVLVPVLAGSIISIIKATSLVILIGVMDILNGALKYANAAYCFFEAYLAAALIYWLFSLIIQWGGNALEQRLGRYRKEL
ncbi:amino acid ABC transporter permease [Lacrimispora indolis]|uniref:amino acid ABC transporter permease n=1 Tax=Lacrimispora indolis TaxID=69825 RepID=UPI00045E8077|nr:ABC transporter permease subunit [Lacrimispora indolis]